jgi:hypothetical protein
VTLRVDAEVQRQHVTEFMETNEVDELADGGLKGGWAAMLRVLFDFVVDT